MQSRFKRRSASSQSSVTVPTSEPQANTTQPKQTKRRASSATGSNPADDAPIAFEENGSQHWGAEVSHWLVPGRVYDISGVHRNRDGQNAYCSFWGYIFVRTESIIRTRDGVEKALFRYVFRYNAAGGQVLNIYDDDIKDYTCFRLAQGDSSMKYTEDFEVFSKWASSQRTSLLSPDNSFPDYEVVEAPEPEPQPESAPKPKRKFGRAR